MNGTVGSADTVSSPVIYSCDMSEAWDRGRLIHSLKQH